MEDYKFYIYLSLFFIVFGIAGGRLISTECDIECPDGYICCQPLKFLPPKCSPICKFVDCPAGQICKIYDGDYYCVPEETTTTTTAPATIAPSTIAPATTAPATIAPVTTTPSTTAPATIAPATIAPATTAPATTAPATTAPATIAPSTIAPATTAPATTAPATIAPATIAPATIAPATIAPATTAPATIAPATTAPATTAPVTTAPATTAPATTTPSTTAPATIAPATIAPATIAPATIAPATIAPATSTTAPATTAPATTAPATTAPATTAPATTALDSTSTSTTGPSTTAPATTSSTSTIAPATIAPATTTTTTTAPATTGSATTGEATTTTTTTAPATTTTTTTAPATTTTTTTATATTTTTTTATATTGSATTGEATTTTTTSTTPTVPVISGGVTTESEPNITPPPVSFQFILKLNSFKGAQSHVIPAQGARWINPGGNQTLHFVGNRTVLAMFNISTTVQPISSTTFLPPLKDVFVKGTDVDGNVLGKLPLSPPSEFPASELNQEKYSDQFWTAKIPREWVKPKLKLTLTAQPFVNSDPIELKVGAPSDYYVENLPVYLYGATPDNSDPINKMPNQSKADEILQKLPIDFLQIEQHPYKFIQWKVFPIPPDGKKPGYLSQSTNDEKSIFDFSSAFVNIMRLIKLQNGDKYLNKQIYSPLLKKFKNGTNSAEYSGVGGVGAGVSCGDYEWGPLFMHETAHGFGLLHCIDSSANGMYPYPGGSLLGSEWGWDANKNLMLIPFMPNGTCPDPLNGDRATDINGRCYKQDPMQDGGGGYDRSRGLFNYATFADWSVSAHQKYLETYWYPDESSPNGYVEWSQAQAKYIPANVTKYDDAGFNSISGFLPIEEDVMVYSVVVAYSLIDPTLSMILEPVHFTGNLIQNFDPTDPNQIAQIVPRIGKYTFYCYRGCDYSLRMTYADGTSATRILNQSFREFGKVTDPVPAYSATSVESMKYWVMHFPGDQNYTKIELLDTPLVFNGFPDSPTVLLTYPK